MVEVIALYLAGLSFFFTGVSGLSDNLRQLSGQRFRVLLARATHHPIAAGSLGVVMGAITQSTSVVAFVLSGMTATGMLSLSRALLVLAYSNVGTALLVFIAALDLHLPTLFLIGASGLILAFKLFNRWKPGFSGLLSFGLILFGLDMAKQAFHPLATAPGVSSVAKLFDYWPDAAFLLGIVMRAFVHSSSAAAAVTITLEKGSLVGELASFMSIAGLGVGTAIATWFLSSNLRGIPRQIALYQALGNVAAGLIACALLVLEQETHLPLLVHLINHITQSQSGRMAVMYFVLNILIVAVSLLGLRWAPPYLAKWCPPTPEQDISRPMYVQTEALNSPETALDLVALEQLRITGIFQRYLQTARGESTLDLRALHEAVHELSAEISSFMEAIVHLPISTALAARVISFQRKQDTLQALEDNIFTFAETLRGETLTSEMAGRLVEALDTLVLTATEALTTRDTMDVDMLVQLTEDRGSMMERLRTRMQLDENKDLGNIAALHYATTLFERNVWLLRQLALWIREDARLNAA